MTLMDQVEQQLAKIAGLEKDLAATSAARKEEFSFLDGAERRIGNPELDIQAGDYVGHPFHGNQWVGGEAGDSGNKASKKAHEATKEADSKGTHKAHKDAEKAHREAADKQELAGNTNAAFYHSAQANYHHEASKNASISKSGKSGGKHGVKGEDSVAIFEEVCEERDALRSELLTAKETLSGKQFKHVAGAAAGDAASAAKGSSPDDQANVSQYKTKAEALAAYNVISGSRERADFRKQHSSILGIK